MEELPLVSLYKECSIEDDFLWAFFSFIYLLIICLLIVILLKKIRLKYNQRIKANSVILFTAHPDDEVMFFGPTIIQMIREGIDFHLICLSVGDYEGEGSKRVDELFNCTKELGIPSENILITKDDRLKDGPNEEWPIDHLSNIMLDYIEIYEPEAVLSFDLSGVSSHSNHIALSVALTSLVSSRNIPSKTSVYLLHTVNIFRKYMSFFDMTFTLLAHGKLYTLSPSDYRILVRAMSKHVSQFIWFRKLYIVFSRYMHINSYKKIT